MIQRSMPSPCSIQITLYYSTLQYSTLQYSYSLFPNSKLLRRCNPMYSTVEAHVPPENIVLTLLNSKCSRVVEPGKDFDAIRNPVGLRCGLSLYASSGTIVADKLLFGCIVITYSRVWINRVRLPILLVIS